MDDVFEWECEHGAHCFRAECLRELSRRKKLAAVHAPRQRRRFRKHVNGFRTVTTLSLTIDNDAIAVLEGLCRQDDMNRSRFISNLIMAEGRRRFFVDEAAEPGAALEVTE